MVEMKKCTGCSACESACPVNSISMQLGSDGFYYPSVDSTTCISCNKCEDVCPALTVFENAENPETVYGAISGDESVKKASSSGGVFHSLAECVIDNRGVVCGAAFDEGFSLKHVLCDDINELYKLQKSKYLQSDMSGIYDDIESLLNGGKLVLFVGTPCQCNALYLYLGKPYVNLFIVDFICHGIPSPAVFKKFLNSVSKDKEVINVDFRDKSSGWKCYNFCVKYSDGTHLKEPYYNNSYMKLFLSDNILRNSCFSCNAKFPNKYSDITLGDLWGAENFDVNDDDSGVSCVFINSEKGKALFDKIKNNVECFELDFDEVVKYNPSAVSSVQIPKYREKCINDILSDDDVDFDKIIKKYIDNKNLLRSAKKLVKRIINR